jgi:hypothetical protein
MKQQEKRLAAVLLMLAAVFLIVRRTVPVQLETLMPKDFSPETCHVGHFGWDGSMVNVNLTEEETARLWALLDDLTYRYNGRLPGGVMKGLQYHLTLTDLEIPEQVHLFVTTQLGVVYLNEREYKMVGDSGPLLEFLKQLK